MKPEVEQEFSKYSFPTDIEGKLHLIGFPNEKIYLFKGSIQADSEEGIFGPPNSVRIGDNLFFTF